MTDDTNPLFLDPDYAAGTKHGGVIAPPVMADYFAGPGISRSRPALAAAAVLLALAPAALLTYHTRTI